MREKKIKTLLIGNFGAGNLGDELILAAALDEYQQKDVVVMTANPKKSQQFTEKRFAAILPFPTGFRSFFRFIASKKIREHYTKHEFDEIVFAGGGLFAIKLRAYVIWGLTRAWISMYYPKTKVKWTHMGVDKTNNGLKKSILRKSMRKMDEISVRDADSAAFLEKILNLPLGKGGKRGLFVKNAGDRAENYLEKMDLMGNVRTKVLVNARAGVKGKTWEEKLTKYEKKDVVYVAMDEKDLRYAPKGVKSVYPRTKTELLELFLAGKVAMGERLHFLLCARALGVPKVAKLRKAYSQKVESFGF